MGEIKAEGLIVVVAKAPQVGKVKTRLCPPLNHSQAARLYTGFLLDTVELALQVPNAQVKVVCPSRQDAHELQRILPQAVSYIAQQGTGLTAALSEAFEVGLALGYSKVLCISSDNPTLPGQYLEKAFQFLENNELVLGPTEDGGYYLIGASQVYPFLFEGMTWSTDTVLAETVRRAEQAELGPRLLPGWYDLDTALELSRFVEELATAGAGAAVHTRQVLATLPPNLLLDPTIDERVY
jgi:rSAM/selenodomain-associated transferase 1